MEFRLIHTEYDTSDDDVPTAVRWRGSHLILMFRGIPIARTRGDAAFARVPADAVTEDHRGLTAAEQKAASVEPEVFFALTEYSGESSRLLDDHYVAVAHRNHAAAWQYFESQMAENPNDPYRIGPAADGVRHADTELAGVLLAVALRETLAGRPVVNQEGEESQ